VGASLASWVDDLRTVMMQARQIGAEQAFEPRRRWEVVSGTPFEDGTATRRSSDLARLIGHSLGVGRAAFGQEMERHCQAAIERMAPKLSALEWSEVLLAAAVRAYLPQVDPHGAWAPLDEESSIYDLSLEVLPPAHLWGDMTRTALGARIDRDALAPLQEGDIVIEIGGVSVSGLSIEQANQLALVGDEARAVTVLRENEKQPQSFRLSAPQPSDEPLAEAACSCCRSPMYPTISGTWCSRRSPRRSNHRAASCWIFVAMAAARPTARSPRWASFSRAHRSFRCGVATAPSRWTALPAWWTAIIGRAP
jgi:carboxyl-terminal processing protease